MSKGCPRKNTHNQHGSSNKKARKTPVLQELVRVPVSSELTLRTTGVHSEASTTLQTTDVTATPDAFSTQTEITANPTVTNTNSADIPVASKYQSGTLASRYAPRTTRSQTAESRKFGSSESINNKTDTVPPAIN